MNKKLIISIFLISVVIILGIIISFYTNNNRLETTNNIVENSINKYGWNHYFNKNKCEDINTSCTIKLIEDIYYSLGKDYYALNLDISDFEEKNKSKFLEITEKVKTGDNSGAAKLFNEIIKNNKEVINKKNYYLNRVDTYINSYFRNEEANNYYISNYKVFNDLVVVHILPNKNSVDGGFIILKETGDKLEELYGLSTALDEGDKEKYDLSNEVIEYIANPTLAPIKPLIEY